MGVKAAVGRHTKVEPKKAKIIRGINSYNPFYGPFLDNDGKEYDSIQDLVAAGFAYFKRNRPYFKPTEEEKTPCPQ